MCRSRTKLCPNFGCSHARLCPICLAGTASDVVVTRYAAHQSLMQTCVAQDHVAFVKTGRLVYYKNNNNCIQTKT